MQKIFWWVIGGAIVVAIVCAGALAYLRPAAAPQPAAAKDDYKNIEYVIDGQRVKLVNGAADVPAAPGSASVVSTRYFGNDFVTDLNGDGRNDTVFLLTQSTGGSGTFYYVVAALDMPEGYRGGEGYFLGDRIAPQTIGRSQDPLHANAVEITYADRADGEPMTATPSVGKSVALVYDAATFAWTVVPPSAPIVTPKPPVGTSTKPVSMQTDLTSKSWQWVRGDLKGGTVLTPKKPERFVLTFKDDGSFGATTDCNGVGGTYVVTDGTIAFSEMMATQMYCEGSDEQVFVKYLGDAIAYRVTPEGMLEFSLKNAFGKMLFR